MAKANCQFRGSGGQYFGTAIIHLVILGSITFGIYYAWGWVRLLKLKASHTTMNGKPVTFTGTGGQLFVLCLVRGLLCLITLGLYCPWALSALLRWRARNTLVGGKPSAFTGTGGSLFFLYLIHILILPLLTLGLYYFWGVRRLYGWKEEHTRYGGERTTFGAGVGGVFKVFVLGNILVAVTFYLFLPWALCMLFKWQIENLSVGDDRAVEHFPPLRTKPLTVGLLMCIGIGFPVLLGLRATNQFQNITKNLPRTARLKVDTNKKRTYKVPKPPSPPEKKPVNVSPRPVSAPSAKPPAMTPPAEPPAMPSSAEPPAMTPPAKPPVTEETVNYDVELNRVNNVLKRDKRNKDALYNRAWLHASKGNFQLAEKDYSMVLEIDDKLEDAHFNRGLVFIEMNKFQEAVNDFTEVIKMHPTDADAYCNRGNAYMKLGKVGLALRDYTAALKADPNNADVYFNRATLNLSRGQKQEAMSDFEKAAALGHDKARKFLNMPPVPPKASQNPIKTSNVNRRPVPASVKMRAGTASGKIHGEDFQVEKATLTGGILTLRQGKDFFPDHAVMIFLFLKDGESAENKVYNISRAQGFGTPHIHMKWKEDGENLPKTEIFMKDYIMQLEFGKMHNGTLPGKISLALPDENQSEVSGTFQAEYK